MLEINAQLLENYNRPKLKLKKLKGVVVHWTANTRKGANALANRNYFNNLRKGAHSNGTTSTIYASVHYIVDDQGVIQCIPEDEVAYHVGAKYYKPVGEYLGEGGSPNNYLIGIEMCVNTDGEWEKTYENTVKLARELLDKYGFTVHDLYRHYDVTGKDCPKMMVEEDEWLEFKNDVNTNFQEEAGIVDLLRYGTVALDNLNVRSGNSTLYPIVDKLNQGDKVTIYQTIDKWHRIGDELWVHKNYVELLPNRMGEVLHPRLNVRRGTGTNFSVVDVVSTGDIVDVFEKIGSWIRIGEDKWVYETYLKVFHVKKGKVNYHYLNVRAGKGTHFEKVDELKGGEIVNVLEQENEWMYLGANRWVHADYIDLID